MYLCNTVPNYGTTLPYSTRAPTYPTLVYLALTHTRGIMSYSYYAILTNNTSVLLYQWTASSGLLYTSWVAPCPYLYSHIYNPTFLGCTLSYCTSVLSQVQMYYLTLLAYYPSLPGTALNLPFQCTIQGYAPYLTLPKLSTLSMS